MGRHLSRQHVETIVGILDGWPTGTKLTWNALGKRIFNRLEISTTRQTLGRHERIKLAFQTRKAGLRREDKQNADERTLAQRLRRETAENARLRAENERYREQLTRWQYNAHKHGVKKQQLEEPLPDVDRNPSTGGRTTNSRQGFGKG